MCGNTLRVNLQVYIHLNPRTKKSIAGFDLDFFLLSIKK